MQNNHDANIKYYVNKLGYLVCTSLNVDQTKLDGVSFIDSLEQAEHVFRVNNNYEEGEAVFIPSIIEKDGLLYGQELNGYLSKTDKTVEDYISQYCL